MHGRIYAGSQRAGMTRHASHPIRRTAGGGGVWHPSQVTLAADMMWQAFDADAPLYTDVSRTTPAVANDDPVMSWPSGRDVDISSYAFKAMRPYADNPAWAPTLKTDDVGHPRVVRVHFSLWKPNGDDSDWLRNKNACVYAFRLKHEGSAGGPNVYAGYDYSPPTGPGIGYTSGGTPNWTATIGQNTPTDTGIARAGADVWTSVILYRTATHDRFYVDGVEVHSVAGGYSSGYACRMLMYALSGQTYRLRRWLIGSNFDETEVPVAGVNDWLSREGP